MLLIVMGGLDERNILTSCASRKIMQISIFIVQVRRLQNVFHTLRCAKNVVRVMNLSVSFGKVYQMDYVQSRIIFFVWMESV